MDKERLINLWREKNVDEKLLTAFDKIPSDIFVSAAFQKEAYHDHPLPTIRKQSISQPTTIIMMMEALELDVGQNVFEVGAGVGYQAALISNVIGENGTIISSEVIPELVTAAINNINSLDIKNTKIIESDGGNGHSEGAPYDRIIMTCACPNLPQPLIDQLKEGGIILAPVGDLESQTMIKGIKRGKGLDLEFLGSFRFVPMSGRHGFKEELLRKM